MGSTTGGGQGAAFGISFGTTWTDDNCDRRYDANTLTSLGQADAALALMCQKPSVAEAMRASGKTCPNASAKSVGGVKTSQPAAMPQYTDPFVRSRLGLGPIGG